MSRVGTRKRKREQGKPTWVGTIPIGPCNGNYRGLELAQEQSRVLANRLLSYSLKAISRVRHQGSSELKALIPGLSVLVQPSPFTYLSMPLLALCIYVQPSPFPYTYNPVALLIDGERNTDEPTFYYGDDEISVNVDTECEKLPGSYGLVIIHLKRNRLSFTIDDRGVLYQVKSAMGEGYEFNLRCIVDRWDYFYVNSTHPWYNSGRGWLCKTNILQRMEAFIELWRNVMNIRAGCKRCGFPVPKTLEMVRWMPWRVLMPQKR